ncbi:MAG: UDP-3-O-(3-hydroxymyristoyl)glucosamine N-acyltransferase [Bacteriovoracaceae bacterium]
MITVHDIAKLLDGEVVGDGAQRISGVAKVEEAGSGMLAFIANPKYEKYAETTAASCVLVSRTFDPSKFSKLPPALIKLDDPYTSFVIAIETFAPKKIDIEPGIHPTAVIAQSAKIGTGCSVGPYVVVGNNSIIDDHVTIHPHVVIGRDVKIGKSCLIYSHVTIREECILGNRVIIQPGAVIGGDGFGFAPRNDKSYRKIPQLGIVVLEDDVEVQANTCVDRATLGETRIKRGTKLDNLVQIAHNVVIGEDTVIAGSSGVAGSTKIGNRNMIGGAVAITGHVFTADDVKIAGGTTATRALDISGATYSGYPAKEAGKWKRIEAASRSLPEMVMEVRDLTLRLDALEQEISKRKQS